MDIPRGEMICSKQMTGTVKEGTGMTFWFLFRRLDVSAFLLSGDIQNTISLVPLVCSSLGYSLLLVEISVFPFPPSLIRG